MSLTKLVLMMAFILVLLMMAPMASLMAFVLVSLIKMKTGLRVGIADGVEPC